MNLRSVFFSSVRAGRANPTAEGQAYWVITFAGKCPEPRCGGRALELPPAPAPLSSTATCPSCSVARAAKSYAVCGWLAACHPRPPKELVGEAAATGKTELGSVLRAVAVEVEGGAHSVRDPIQYVCIKVQQRAAVVHALEQAQRAAHVDNPFLDRALLQELAPSPFTLRLIECGHDEKFMYSVTELTNTVQPTRLLPPSGGFASGDALAEAEARHVLRGVCSALRDLHGLGWCHKDVDPSNIVIVNPRQDAPFPGILGCAVRLIDFGTAVPMVRVGVGGEGGGGYGYDAREWAHFERKEKRLCFGKAAFACPSYANELRWRGVEFDVFSVGATLFAYLFGRPAYASPVYISDMFKRVFDSNGLLVNRAKAVNGAWNHNDGRTLPPDARAAVEPALGLALDGPFEQELRRLGATLQPPISLDALDFIARTMRFTPALRPPSMDYLLGHPFLR
jgi:serine/threonine protein kinase